MSADQILQSAAKPSREGHPRWNVAEVHEWMRARRDERLTKRKAA